MDPLELPQPTRLPRPGETLCGCVVEHELGRGAMGAVFAGRTAQGAAVALKVLLGPAGGQRQARLARELELMRGLDHRHIVRVLGGDPSGPLPCLVLERIDGRELGAVLAEADVPLRVRLELLEQVCRAVQHAHERGVIHRDLKPSNVLVTADLQAKVGDFGLARDVQARERLTRTGTELGTPAYMAPEQVRAEKDVGPAADVYALGVMTFEALTGRLPYAASTPMALYQAILEERPPRPSRLARSLGPAHDAVALRALEKDPARRHPSAGALADDLRRLRLGAGRAPRSRAALALGGALLLAGIGALALSSRGGLPRAGAPAGPAAAADPAREPTPDPADELRQAARALREGRPDAVDARLAALGRLEGVLDERARALAGEARALREALARADELLARFEAFTPADEQATAGWGSELEDATVRALELAPDDPRVLVRRARALDLALEGEAASALLERALALEGAVALDARERGPALELFAALHPYEVAKRSSALLAAARLEPPAPGALFRLALEGSLGVEPPARTAAAFARVAAAAAAVGDEALRATAGALAAWQDGLAAPDGSSARRAALLQADEALTRRLLSAPQDARALLARAWVRRDLGDAERAQADERASAEALRASRGRLGYLYRLGWRARRAYENAGRTDGLARGLAALERVLAEDPHHCLAAAELGIVALVTTWRQARPDRATLFQASTHLERSVATNGSWWEARFYRGHLLMGSDPERAEAEFGRAVELSPEHRWSWLGRARARLARGHWADAERDARHACALDPAGAMGRAEWAEALRRQGRAQEAAQVARGERQP